MPKTTQIHSEIQDLCTSLTEALERLRDTIGETESLIVGLGLMRKQGVDVINARAVEAPTKLS